MHSNCGLNYIYKYPDLFVNISRFGVWPGFGVVRVAWLWRGSLSGIAFIMREGGGCGDCGGAGAGGLMGMNVALGLLGTMVCLVAFALVVEKRSIEGWVSRCLGKNLLAAIVHSKRGMHLQTASKLLQPGVFDAAPRPLGTSAGMLGAQVRSRAGTSFGRFAHVDLAARMGMASSSSVAGMKARLAAVASFLACTGLLLS